MNTTKFKEGDFVRQEFGGPVMQVVGFEPELIENVITQWEDQEGAQITAKFAESVLVAAEDDLL
jgi:uncharacterized protein YodC (DUF2158 family)